MTETLTASNDRLRVNLIWERTQAAIAIFVVIANMIVGVYQGLLATDARPDFPVVLSSALFLITGFYFGRTNHLRPFNSKGAINE
jgi:hypothetical protein